MKIRRVKVIVGFALIGCVCFMLSSTGAIAQKKIELKIGIASYMLRDMPFKQIAQQYESAHPGVKISITPVAWQQWSEIIQKFRLEAVRKTASYDFMIGATPFLDVAAAVKLGVLEPLDDVISQEAKDDILPSIREEILFNGKIYSFPLVVDVVGLIYRPSMLKKAGYLSPPENWDETLECCEKISKVYQGKIYPLGFDWYWRPWGGYMPILQTYTDKPFVNGRTDTWSSAARKTLELMKAFYPYMPPSAAENLGASKDFQRGAVAMELYWQPQMLRAIQAGQPADDIEMTSLPKGIRGGTVFWSTCAVVMRYGQHKQEAGNFLSEALRSRLAYKGYLDNWKIFPFKSAYKMLSHELLDFYPRLVSYLETGEAKPIPASGYIMGAELDVMREEFSKLMYGKQSVQETMDNLTRRIGEKIKEMGE